LYYLDELNEDVSGIAFVLICFACVLPRGVRIIFNNLELLLSMVGGLFHYFKFENLIQNALYAIKAKGQDVDTQI